MPISTGWQYAPNQNPLDTLSAQTAANQNPNVRGDNGNASASSPFLSAALSSGHGDGLTGGYNSWSATAQNVSYSDLQTANNQTALLAQKQAQDNYNAQQKRLQQMLAAAQKAGDAQQAKAYQLELTARQNATSWKNSLGSYNYQANGGTGAVSSARGLSGEGQSQLATARADGYNLSASNYDRTYRYNNQYSAMRNQALSDSYSWLGTHYVLGGESKQVEVDCSGLVQSVYSKLGYNIPLHSAAHEGGIVGNVGIPGVRTSFSNLQPGDLVCWKDGSHIAVYAGNGEIIEAANTKVGTVRRPLWDNPNNVVGIHLTFGDEGRAQGQGRR